MSVCALNNLCPIRYTIRCNCRSEAAPWTAGSAREAVETCHGASSQGRHSWRDFDECKRSSQVTWVGLGTTSQASVFVSSLLTDLRYVLKSLLVARARVIKA